MLHHDTPGRVAPCALRFAAVTVWLVLAGCTPTPPPPTEKPTVTAVLPVPKPSELAASPVPKPSAVVASPVPSPSALASAVATGKPALAIAVGPPTSNLPDPNTVEVPPPGTCHASNGLPDRTCTPGLLNPDLVPARLCTAGFSTKTIRPPISYTDVLKRRLMVSYGLNDSPARYELDHLVSLEDLGHPWSPKNLWPMARGKTLPGSQPTGVTTNTAEEKDQIETAVHAAICATPNDAAHITDLQQRLATDWTQIKRIAPAVGVNLTAAPPKEEDEP